jgi:DNA-binding transcriptional MocR family regulator
MALLQPGDVVAVDALTYPGFKVLAESLRFELAPVPVTPDGPDLDVLEELCARRRIKVVYTMPTLHNPLGWVMDAPARTRLIDTARRFGLLIIEDAAYAYLVEKPPPPLAALAPDITVYVSGLSKNVATGLRVGFIAAPSALVPAMERAIRATTWNTPAITTAIACRWLDDGVVTRLEEACRMSAIHRPTSCGSRWPKTHGQTDWWPNSRDNTSRCPQPNPSRRRPTSPKPSDWPSGQPTSTPFAGRWP